MEQELYAPNIYYNNGYDAHYAPIAHQLSPYPEEDRYHYEEEKKEEKKVRWATCDLEDPAGQSGVSGLVTFTQVKGEKMELTATVSGLSPGSHGFHVHAFGDISGGCKSTGGHFNPTGTDHGAHDDPHDERHVGDLKSLVADRDGNVQVTQTDSLAGLWGDDSIIGRGLVLHGGQDDLGRGGNAGSLANGNAGPRVACCVIGIAAEPKEEPTERRGLAPRRGRGRGW